MGQRQPMFYGGLGDTVTVMHVDSKELPCILGLLLFSQLHIFKMLQFSVFSPFFPSGCFVYLSVFAVQFAAHRTYDDNYYGLLATMDVYGHELKRGQWSSTQIWVGHDGDGSKSSDNTINVGWHVSNIFPFHSDITFNSNIEFGTSQLLLAANRLME